MMLTLKSALWMLRKEDIIGDQELKATLTYTSRLS